MAGVTTEQLAGVTSFPKLVALLRDKLEWPIYKDYELEDIVYEYEPAELGLKPDETAKIREIRQLRPLTTNQPWGIFFISFENKAIAVTVLRRMLRALVVNKRGEGKSSDKQAWAKNDLIFAANFGKSGERELAFVHFSDEGETGDLPVLKVLGWNARDTQLHNEHAAELLTRKLRWPDNDKDQKAWREQWSSAFEVGHNEVTRTSQELAIRLAVLATEIRARANALLKAESDKGPMRKMLEAFRKNLIQNLDEDGFADMFAQTIAYGLLAAHISRPSGGLVADNLVDMVPKTNPFLRELFSTFLSLGGRDKRKKMDFDELGVRDVVDMLRNVNMEAVLRDFGDRNPKEDPVIHFYELFLKQYDPKKRMQRGVFYTPRPVVNFIVRGVDEILRTEFGLPLGLADTTTWGNLTAKNDKIKLPAHINPDTPFVQILDPATGTGTFLVEVIGLIYKTMTDHWKSLGRPVAAIKDAWNEYVPRHLLPRLIGFELMMAPYAIAHMKIGLKLVETGYRFGSEERARVFLTNALEPPRDLDMEFIFMSEALAHEALAASTAKSNTAFTVIIGNPPYSLMSGNLSNEARLLVAPYRFVNGIKIQERGALQAEKNLQDDYVKFYRMAEVNILSSHYGILSYITNHAFLDNRTLRGMRCSMLSTFSKLAFLNLNGSVTRATGDLDENIFEIQQGVAVSLLRSVGKSDVARTTWGSLIGSRESKYTRLLDSSMTQLSAQPVEPHSDNFSFESNADPANIDYRTGNSLTQLMSLYSSGIITARDHFTIDMDANVLVTRARSFVEMKSELARQTFQLGKDTNDWKINLAQKDLRANAPIENSVRNIAYRPFDIRKTIYTGQARGFLCNPRAPVMANVIGVENLSLLCCRQQSVPGFRHVLVTDQISEGCVVSNRTREITSAFPLWFKPTAGETYRRPNIDPVLANAFGQQVHLSYDDGIPKNQQHSFGADYRTTQPQQTSLLDGPGNGRGDLTRTFGPRDLFDWIYAVLHSPHYRSRHAESLKSDFPRIPTPGTGDLFRKLVKVGRELVALHLLRPEEAPILKNPEIRFAGTGEARVAKSFPKYENGKVMINASRWFEDVPQATWEFNVGGYQVCQKWLKDRAAKDGKRPSRGRVLTDEDILHYRRVVTALSETRRLMAEIDRVIEEHGGWPGAFKGTADA